MENEFNHLEQSAPIKPANKSKLIFVLIIIVLLAVLAAVIMLWIRERNNIKTVEQPTQKSSESQSNPADEAREVKKEDLEVTLAAASGALKVGESIDLITLIQNLTLDPIKAEFRCTNTSPALYFDGELYNPMITCGSAMTYVTLKAADTKGYRDQITLTAPGTGSITAQSIFLAPGKHTIQARWGGQLSNKIEINVASR